jgi:hypothetical protein
MLATSNCGGGCAITSSRFPIPPLREDCREMAARVTPPCPRAAVHQAERAVPRYFFNVHGETFANPDMVGRDLVDDDAARAEAHQLAKEVVVAELTGGLPEKTWVEVVDEDQRPILLMPIDEAPAGPTRHV